MSLRGKVPFLYALKCKLYDKRMKEVYLLLSEGKNSKLLLCTVTGCSGQPLFIPSFPAPLLCRGTLNGLEVYSLPYGGFLGGKGGFGNLLRQQKRWAKKTENNDASRDLQGRRLRDVNAEQRLAAWAEQRQQEERNSLQGSVVEEAARSAKQLFLENLEEWKKIRKRVLDEPEIAEKKCKTIKKSLFDDSDSSNS